MTDRATMELSLGPKGTRRKDVETPLRVLILSSLTPSPEADFAAVRPRRVTIDNFDRTLRDVGPSLTLTSSAGTPADGELRFESLDDLHPDTLAARLPHIEALRMLGARLANPATQETALADLAALRGTPAGAEKPAGPTGPLDEKSGQADDDAMFDRLLGSARSQDAGRTRAQQIVQSLISDAIGDAGSPPSSGLARSAEGQVTELMNESMRASLMASPFRELERAWRSLHWLITRVDESAAEIFVVDASKSAIAADLAANRDRLEGSAIHRLICGDADGWDMIVGDMSFGLDADDIVILATLGAFAARAQAPFIAHGDLSLAGCHDPDSVDAPWDWSLPESDLGALWGQLRQHPAARWIALAAPRFILRQPYGAKTDPIDAFRFEELPARPSGERFLWGNPAFACAALMIQAHAEGETHWPAATIGDIEDLPTPVFDDGSGEAIQPGVEFLLSERACAVAEQSGLVTFASGRNTNRMRASAIGPIAL